jgi:hypothetical protein
MSSQIPTGVRTNRMTMPSQRAQRNIAPITPPMPQVATAQFVRHNSIPEAYWRNLGTCRRKLPGCEQIKYSTLDHAYESFELHSKIRAENTWA